jgi:hypothetical protein
METSLAWPRYARTLGVMATCGFFASLGVYAYSYSGDSVSRQFPPIWLLHIGIFVVFGPAVFVVDRARKRGDLYDLLASFPKAVFAAAAVLLLAATVAGMQAMTSLEGSPEELPSGYVLNNHGNIRQLSRQEYLQAKAAEDRGFSAIWLEFYGLSALFWLGRGGGSE